MKLCKDCIFVKGVIGSYEMSYLCTHPEARRDINLMTGRITYDLANYSRYNASKCGEKGKWFVQKPISKGIIQQLKEWWFDK